MLAAERRKRMALAEKIGHEEYIYRLNGDPSKLPMTGAAGAPYAYHDGYAQGGGSYGYAGGIGGGGLGFGGGLYVDQSPPIVPSLAPPESLPPVLPTVHYPKPPVYFHTKGSSTIGCSTGARLRPLQAPLPSSTSSYVMAPSNTAISTSLPGYAALPPVRPQSSAAPLPQVPPLSRQQYFTPPPINTTYTNTGSRVIGGGGASSAMSGVLNWSASPSNIGMTRNPAPGYMGSAYGPPRQAVPPPPPPGYLYDPADLPPAGKVTNRKPMPTYFNASEMPTPSTTPRYRGSSQGLTFTTGSYTDIHPMASRPRVSMAQLSHLHFHAEFHFHFHRDVAAMSSVRFTYEREFKGGSDHFYLFY
eukprot:gene10042-7017_t